MSRIAAFPKPLETQGPAADAADNRVSGLLSVIEMLSTEEQSRLLQALSEKVASAKPAKGKDDLLGTIIRLLPKQRLWTVAEVKEQVDGAGLDVEAKAIYNVMTYLRRTGQVQRVAYGRYMIGGVPIVSPDDLGGQPSITEGDGDD